MKQKLLTMAVVLAFLAVPGKLLCPARICPGRCVRHSSVTWTILRAALAYRRQLRVCLSKRMLVTGSVSCPPTSRCVDRTSAALTGGSADRTADRPCPTSQ